MELALECASANISLHAKTVNRAIGNNADKAKYQLLDFICYVGNKKKTLSETVYEYHSQEHINDTAKYEVEIPEYALLQFQKMEADITSTEIGNQHAAISVSHKPKRNVKPKWAVLVGTILLVLASFIGFRSVFYKDAQGQMSLPLNKNKDADTLVQPMTNATVTINGSIWSAKNLNVSNYQDGTPIKEAKSYGQWKDYCSQKVGCWCFYAFQPAYDTIYGKLYNWYAATDTLHGGIVPSGYKLPSIQEFSYLLRFAGGKDHQAKLMSTRKWLTNINENNRLDFNALPSGSISSYESGFLNLGEVATWWAIDNLKGGIWTFSISVDTLKTGLFKYTDGGGCAIRCVRY